MNGSAQARSSPNRHQEARAFPACRTRITSDPSTPNRSPGAGWEFVQVCIDDHSGGAAMLRWVISIEEANEGHD